MYPLEGHDSFQRDFCKKRHYSSFEFGNSQPKFGGKRKKQVVIGLLQGLGDGVKLALVAAAVAAVATGVFPTYAIVLP